MSSNASRPGPIQRLIDRITRLFGDAPDASGTVTTQSPVGPRTQTQLDVAQRFMPDRDRQERLATARQMYEDDTRAKEVLKSMARDVMMGGYELIIEDAGAADSAAMLEKQLDLQRSLENWVRLCFRDGDLFLEIGVDDSFNIVEVTRKPIIGMHRYSNTFDQFDDPTHAYWYSDRWYGGEPPPEAVWFSNWQVVQARWDHDEGERYGRPFFASGSGAWKRLKEGELDISVRRKTRAGIKYQHKFPPGTKKGTIDEYKVINKDALTDPLAAVADFFGTPDINVLQGDARLGEIADVLYHLRTWFIVAPMPMSLMGYGEDLNRDVLTAQEQQYRRALEGMAKWVEKQLLVPLLERQWLLHGFWPPHLDYSIQWASKQPLTAQVLQRVADAALRFRALGWPDELLVQLLAPFLPGVNLETLLQVKQTGPATPERIARAAELIRQVTHGG